MSPGPLRVLVVGRDPLARSGIAAALGSAPGLAVVGQSGAEDADRLAKDASAQTVVLDLGLGGDASITDTGLPTLVLAGTAAQAGDALARAAMGALFRDAGAGRIAAGLQAIYHGLVVMEPEFVQEHQRSRAVPAGIRGLDTLTPRETEVLGLLAMGLSNKEIASQLGISDHTAKFHVNAILDKMGAKTRTEAVVLAARLGLLLL
jgi:two-component system nitrate/nitrite response regulator NarL